MEAHKEKSTSLLERIVDGWGKRAKIRKDFVEMTFFEERPDFLENLLPFHNHPLYKQLDSKQRNNCLSCGWIIYNEKTLIIESEIVNPACKNIIDGHIAGLKTNVARLAACETLIDEAYHMLLVEKANQITRSCRDLHHIVYPSFHISKSMNQAYMVCNEPWMKPLLQVAVATVTEVLVSEYLSQLSTCDTIQPMNRLTVATHLYDELAHSKIFSSMLSQFYYLLPSKQKNFFSSSLVKAVCWFSNNELDLWKPVLQQLGIYGWNEIIEDCRASNIQSIDIDCSDLVAVLESNGILEDNYSHDLFADSNFLKA